MSKRAAKVQLNIIFRSEPEGGFTVTVPSLPGCITYGQTLDEAKKMVQEAILLYVEDLIEEGEQIPKDTQTYLSNVEVVVPSRSLAHV